MLSKTTSEKIVDLIHLLYQPNVEVPLTIQQIGREMNIIFEEVQLLEEDNVNIREELYSLYEEVKKCGDARVMLNGPSSQKLFSGVRPTRLFSYTTIPDSTELSNSEIQELYQHKYHLDQKNTQIQTLQEEIDKLEQRLDIQKRNYEWEIQYYERQRYDLKQMFSKILNKGLTDREQNRKLIKGVEQLNESNREILKLLKENPPEKKKKSKHRIMKGNEKKSIIQALNQPQTHDGPIHEKLCHMRGVTFIHSSLQDI